MTLSEMFEIQVSLQYKRAIVGPTTSKRSVQLNHLYRDIVPASRIITVTFRCTVSLRPSVHRFGNFRSKKLQKKSENSEEKHFG